jgi:hypothetical protein
MAAGGYTAPPPVSPRCVHGHPESGSHENIPCGDLRGACCMYVRKLVDGHGAPEGRSEGTGYIAYACVCVCVLCVPYILPSVDREQHCYYYKH